ncbi:metal ABC transporter ATP-binding protein [Reinekea marinisedimentorum]|uniref:Zinc/manganese transport system ATP-binding protein n=1 Tax=Reinekea marinisedimentorum TaxID=230495 RepID=A0A4V2UK31_9GAMM|nr:ABC transporter ATP-binding protein [Reinekea marinisedimentorum]TCS42506.1 zinc/manganese transport system ATP-binding protein [Reinekea marinisedimentorum]
MLKFENLTIGYNRHPAVHHLNATISEGDFIALIGPNGAGKSTLLKTILGHVLPLEGKVLFNNISKTEISYLPQSSAVDRKFPISAEQFVATGLWHESGPFQRITKEQREKIHHALRRVGMHGFEKRPINALSGGQFQRVLFARKLIQNARLLLLDEPFAAVDEQTIEDLMKVLIELHNSGATIVAVVHNLELVRKYFPKTMILSRELIGFGLTAEVITTENLARASSIGFGDVKADICEVSHHA